jgi:hypothetical protein
MMPCSVAGPSWDRQDQVPYLDLAPVLPVRPWEAALAAHQEHLEQESQEAEASEEEALRRFPEAWQPAEAGHLAWVACWQDRAPSPRFYSLAWFALERKCAAQRLRTWHRLPVSQPMLFQPQPLGVECLAAPVEWPK